MNINTAYPIRRVLVAVDLTSHDESLVQYISKVSHLTELDCIYFLHVVNTLNLPEEIVAKYPDLVAPVDESIEKNIQFTIDHFGNLPKTIRLEILVREGNPTKEILKAVQQKEIDLLVVGRKSDEEANLNILEKTIRAASCSISVIPEYLPDILRKVLVPMDFSENSLMALDRARMFTEKFPGLEVLTVHGYEVPTGYTKVGKTFGEFSEIMKKNAEKEMELFIRKYEVNMPNLEAHYIRSKKKNLPSAIYQFAAANNIDAIIIGSRGRDSISHLILGSVAEGLIDHDQYMPLIITKSKTDHMNLLDTLKEI